MSGVVQPTPAPNVELELAKLAADAMQDGQDPQMVTGRLHTMIRYLRQYPKMAEQATNALADGVATPADITRKLWPHAAAIENAQTSGTHDAAAERAQQNVALHTFDDPAPVASQLANIAQGLPPAKAIQSGLRAITHGEPYRQAYQDVDAATADLPDRTVGRMIGASVLGPILPESPAAAGALLGGADQAFDANPDVSLSQRAARTGIGAVVGGLVGKTTGNLATAVRAKLAESPGANLFARRATMKATDLANYGNAEREGAQAAASGAMPQDITDALNAPDIKPYADAVRNSRKFAGADDPTVLREAYKLMSERQGTLSKRMLSADDFKAGTSLDNADVGLAKQQMLNAADQIMPSFRTAVEQHAEQAGQQDALRLGAKAARLAMRGNIAHENKLATASPEAIAAAFRKMPVDQAQAATEGLLGRAGQQPVLNSLNPFRAFGATSALSGYGNVEPYLRALDAQTGAPAGLLSRLLLTSGNAAISP